MSEIETGYLRLGDQEISIRYFAAVLRDHDLAIVPIKPTDEMSDDGARSRMAGRAFNRYDAARCYRTMLAARPAALK